MAVKPQLMSGKLLAGDEKIMLETRSSKIKYLTGGFFAVIGMIISLFLSFWESLSWLPDIPFLHDLMIGSFGGVVSMIFVIIALILFLYFVYRYLVFISTAFAITTERIMIKKGLLNRKYEDISIRMITSVEVTQSIFQRMLGYGTVIFSTESGSADDVVWKAVPNPLRVRRVAQEVMDPGFSKGSSSTSRVQD